MIEFDAEAACRAPIREVWKLLYDPVRFASWWPGWERVEPGDGAVTHYDARWPDFAYPTTVTADAAAGRIVVSCMLSDIVHTWGIAPADSGCVVSVRVEIPDPVADKTDLILGDLRAAVAALVARAEAS
jgi:uncharacterized protein YndB with AHSA1/START domain